MIGKTNAQAVGSVNGKTGLVEITKSDVGLANVPNIDATDASNISSGTLPQDRLPTVPVAKGGTGATTAANARTNLGVTPANIGAIPTTEKGAANGVATLDSNNKVPLSQINDSIIGQVEYKGTWNANTNTPTLPATPAEKGLYYVVSVGGTRFSITFEVGDWIISNGTAWEKVDNTDAVSSVAGKTGVVTLTKSDVGLGNVDNTSDANKPVSMAMLTELDLKLNRYRDTVGYVALYGISSAGVDQMYNAMPTKTANTLVFRDSQARIKAHTAADSDDVVNLSQMNDALANKVDKVAGKELSRITLNEEVTTAPSFYAPTTAGKNNDIAVLDFASKKAVWKDTTDLNIALVSDLPPASIKVTNASVSNWTADTSVPGMSYKADITVTGATADDFAEVVFSQADAVSGNYALVNDTGANKVTIYSKVNTAITVPTIVVHRG